MKTKYIGSKKKRKNNLMIIVNTKTKTNAELIEKSIRKAIREIRNLSDTNISFEIFFKISGEDQFF